MTNKSIIESTARTLETSIYPVYTTENNAISDMSRRIIDFGYKPDLDMRREVYTELSIIQMCKLFVDHEALRLKNPIDSAEIYTKVMRHLKYWEDISKDPFINTSRIPIQKLGELDAFARNLVETYNTSIDYVAIQKELHAKSGGKRLRRAYGNKTEHETVRPEHKGGIFKNLVSTSINTFGDM
jgi:hypothetical protein